jgi:hypothetical protein
MRHTKEKRTSLSHLVLDSRIKYPQETTIIVEILKTMQKHRTFCDGVVLLNNRICKLENSTLIISISSHAGCWYFRHHTNILYCYYYYTTTTLYTTTTTLVVVLYYNMIIIILVASSCIYTPTTVLLLWFGDETINETTQILKTLLGTLAK